MRLQQKNKRILLSEIKEEKKQEIKSNQDIELENKKKRYDEKYKRILAKLEKRKKKKLKIKEKKLMKEMEERNFWKNLNEKYLNGDNSYKLSNYELLYFNKICLWKEHITIESIPWELTKGESFGKYKSEQFYESETFILEINSHFLFIKNWDILLLEEWSSTNNEFGIITTYPKSITEYFNRNSIVVENNNNNDMFYNKYLNVMCNKIVTDWSLRNMLQNQFGSIQFKYNAILQPFFSSSFSFSKGHRLFVVNYDPFYDTLVEGLEFDLEIRLFTNGYDFYAPHINILWNYINDELNKKEYDPIYKKEIFRTLFRNNWKKKNEAMVKSTHRLRKKTNIYKYIEQDTDYEDFDNTHLNKYNLGDIRSLNEYLNFAGIDLINNKIKNKCIQIRDNLLKRVPIKQKWTNFDIKMLRDFEINGI